MPRPRAASPLAHRPGPPLAIVLTALACWTPTARAASPEVDGPATGTAPAVYDVYVTSERDAVDAVTTVREIDRSHVLQLQARDLEESLQQQPSLVIRRGGEGVARIDIRGLRTRQILFLVDGVPQRTTNDGNFDPDLVPSQIIESIDVTYGASSVLYGDGPLAGVLQVRTRSGKEGVEVEARGDARSRGQYLGQAGVLAGRGGVTGFAAGSYRTEQGYQMSSEFVPTTLENGGLRDNSDGDQGNFFAKAGWSPGDRGRVDLLVDYRSAQFGVPWNTVDDPNDPFAQRPRFERMNDLEGFSLQLSGQVEATDDLALRSWGYVNRQSEHLTRYDDTSLDSVTSNGTYSLEDTALITGGAFHGRQDLGRFGALRFALNGRYEQLDTNGFVNRRQGSGGGAPVVAVPVDQRDDYGAWSLGAEYEVSPVERSAIVVGYAHAFLEGTDPVDADGPIFLAGAHYDFTTGTRLRASAARKLRFPSIRQLFDTNGGNPYLSPEQCWCYEVAVEQALPFDSRLVVVGYWMDLDDFIERLTSGAPFENRQSVRNRGVEVVATSRPVDALQLKLAYTFLDAEDVTPYSPNSGPLDNRPRHKIDAVARYTFPTRTSIRAGLTWAGDIIEYTRTSPRVAGSLPDFVQLDLLLEQQLGDSDQVRLYLGVQNVNDALWTYNYGFPQPGRTVLGGLEVRFF
jgi:outer membrane cobalamin receptor